jgi:hypothetical protein
MFFEIYKKYKKCKKRIFLYTKRKKWRLLVPIGSRDSMRFTICGLYWEPAWRDWFLYRFLFNHHHGKGIFYHRKQRGFPKGHGKLSYALVTG